MNNSEEFASVNSRAEEMSNMVQADVTNLMYDIMGDDVDGMEDMMDMMEDMMY